MPATPPIPSDEAQRLVLLRELVVLDSAPEEVFDSITRMASQVCGAPIALLSLVDDERQWFKANVGMPGLNETPRDVAFCAHAICSSDVLQVHDAASDARFADNPLVTGGPQIRFYAGAPLLLQEGDGPDRRQGRMGTLCVIDLTARTLSPQQLQLLQSLADLATQTLVMRRDLITRTLTVATQQERMLRTQQAFLQRIGQVAGVGGWQLDLASGELTWSDETYTIHEVARDHVPTLDSSVAFYAPEAQPVITAAVQHSMATGAGWDLELPFITAKGRQRWVRAQGEAEFDGGRPVRLVGAFQDITERRAAEQRLRELTAITEHSPDFVLQTDARGFIVHANAAARRALLLGADDDLSRRHHSEFNTPDTNALFTQTIMPALQRDGIWLGDTTVLLHGGRSTPVSHLVIAHRDGRGRIERYSAVIRDISAAVQARRQLQQQSSTLASVAEAIPAMVSVIGADTRLRFVNSAFERWFGAPRDRLLGHTLQEVLGRNQYAVSRPYIARALAGEVVQFEKEYPGRDSFRHAAISYTPLWLEGGVIDGFVAVAHDISQHRQEQGRLRQLSERDPLTGLFNRAGFESSLQRCMEDDGGAFLALLYIDLDRFKPVNDRHGHATGDQLLQAFAQRLLTLVRPTDAVARLGGDEFAIALPGVRFGANARRVADKVLAAAHAPFDVGALRLHIGASVGVAFGADEASGGWRALLARADAMLYSAKADGRGRQAGEAGSGSHGGHGGSGSNGGNGADSAAVQTRIRSEFDLVR